MNWKEIWQRGYDTLFPPERNRLDRRAYKSPIPQNLFGKQFFNWFRKWGASTQLYIFFVEWVDGGSEGGNRRAWLMIAAAAIKAKWNFQTLTLCLKSFLYLSFHNENISFIRARFTCFLMSIINWHTLERRHSTQTLAITQPAKERNPLQAFRLTDSVT